LRSFYKSEVRISNNEYPMSKELYSDYFTKKTEHGETTLRNFAVQYSLFCGSLFNPLFKFLTVDAIGLIDPAGDSLDNIAHAFVVFKNPGKLQILYAARDQSLLQARNH